MGIPFFYSNINIEITYNVVVGNYFKSSELACTYFKQLFLSQYLYLMHLPNFTICTKHTSMFTNGRFQNLQQWENFEQTLYLSNPNMFSSLLGYITSGCPSPSLKKNVAMAYVPLGQSKIGSKVTLSIYKKSITAEVTKMPFVPANYFH